MGEKRKRKPRWYVKDGKGWLMQFFSRAEARQFAVSWNRDMPWLGPYRVVRRG